MNENQTFPVQRFLSSLTQQENQASALGLTLASLCPHEAASETSELVSQQQ